MKTLLHKIFVDNWQRKAVSASLAIIIWFMVNQSLIISKPLSNIPVRVINIPSGKTVMDLQNNGILTKRITLTLVGNKTLLDSLSSNDLEVVIDANDNKDEWIADITKRNLVSLNPEVDLNKGITRVGQKSMIIRLTKLVSEKIPVFITQPIGEPPRGYQFLDIWPYQLNLTVSGPEEIIKRLKTRGIRRTFDLSNISKAELDALRSRPDSTSGDEVSFFVPEQWKRVDIPLLSDTSIEIDDPKAKDLRIDFVRVSMLPIRSNLPVALYFPSEGLKTYNPKTITLDSGPLIKKVNGLTVFSKPLFAKGVSQLFLRVVEQMIQMSITVDPTQENRYLNWSIEFINPRLLEDRFVSLMMSDVSDTEIRELQPLVREEYLRNRFRSYMNSLRLYLSEEKRLAMNIRLENNKVVIEEGGVTLPNSKSLIKE